MLLTVCWDGDSGVVRRWYTVVGEFLVHSLVKSAVRKVAKGFGASTGLLEPDRDHRHHAHSHLHPETTTWA